MNNTHAIYKELRRKLVDFCKKNNLCVDCGEKLSKDYRGDDVCYNCYDPYPF